MAEKTRKVIGVLVRAGSVVLLLVAFLVLPLVTLDLQGTEVWCGGVRACTGATVNHGIGACFELLSELNTDDDGTVFVAIQPDMQVLEEETSILWSVLVALVGFADLMSLLGLSRAVSGFHAQFVFVVAGAFRLAGALVGWAAINMTATFRKNTGDNDEYIGMESELGSGAWLLLAVTLVSYVFPSDYGRHKIKE